MPLRAILGIYAATRLLKAGTAIQLMAGYAYLQEYKRNIDRSVREIEREKTKLQQQVPAPGRAIVSFGGMTQSRVQDL